MSNEREILTVGHSNHDERGFLELLSGAGVEAVADVRANPRSRLQHFNRSSLAASLQTAGIDYEGFGEELGGRRTPAPDSPNDAWEDQAFRGYADHMASEEFARGLDRLERLARSRRTAAMCAEGDWRSCHRRLLADALVLRGWRVLHLAPDGVLAPHEFNPLALVEGTRITYPGRQTSLGV